MLLYAVNGVGLGHVVRLSVIADALRAITPGVSVSYVSNSKAAPSFFTCPGLLVPDNPKQDHLWRVERHLRGFLQAVLRFKPDIIVCDTHWPRPLIGQLRSRGIRTAIIMRSLRADLFLRELDRAKQDFDAIIVPHHPSELSYLLQGYEGAEHDLEHPLVAVVGPIARIGPARPNESEIIFTLGGGGDCAGTSCSAEDLMTAFSGACKLLMRRGKRCTLAAGPFLKTALMQMWPGDVRRSPDLVSALTERSVVITRPGYNTCWETVAAGCHLVLVGSQRVVEDTHARAAFLTKQGLAVRVPQDAASVAKAVLQAKRFREIPREWRLQVNAGLRTLCAEILGRGHLRDAESLPRVRGNLCERSKPLRELAGKGPIVVRFDGVEASSQEASLERLAVHALRSNMRVQLHCLNSGTREVSEQIRRLLAMGCEAWSHVRRHPLTMPYTSMDLLLRARTLEKTLGCAVIGTSVPLGQHLSGMDCLFDAGYRLSVFDHVAPSFFHPGLEACVDPLSFPGPRWMSEVHIFRRLKSLVDARIPSGICVRVGQVPEYLYRQTITQLTLLSSTARTIRKNPRALRSRTKTEVRIARTRASLRTDGGGE